MNEINLQANNSEVKKEPCFKCIVSNLPGGKMSRLHHQCSDCEPKWMKEQRQKYLDKLSIHIKPQGKYKKKHGKR